MAEPGVGKSRLCHEFARRVRTSGVQVFTAQGLAHARSAPFVPVLELLRAQFGISDQDDAATARAKIIHTARELNTAIDDAVPLIHDSLGVADPERPASAVDAEARQRQMATGATCQKSSGAGRAVFTVPTAEGLVEFVNHFTYEPEGLIGTFEGPLLSGVFTLGPPTTGDCLSEPLTLVTVTFAGKTPR